MASNGVHKPNVLVLGGVGFIGRNLVHYLVSNELVAKIRVVDKVPPAMGFLNARHSEAFSKVQFKHANLINPTSVAKAFHTDDGTIFDYVFNCAAETKLAQTEAVYRDGIFKLSCNCASEAEKHGAQRFIELSTAQMYSTDKTPINESVSCEPWTLQGRFKLAVEQELANNFNNLDYIILRPALVYGSGDRIGLVPRLVIGGIYKVLGEKMKVLWTRDLKMNTVHVEDVAHALWHLCQNGRRGEIYHLADSGDTTQGKFGDLVSEIFGINIDYVGSVVSSFANLSLHDVVDDVNEKHMVPWGEACNIDDIQSTPLSPYIEEEVLRNKQLFVDGSKIQQTGFTYRHPKLTKELLQSVIHEYIELKLFPRSLYR
ncbi:hypothetical protein CAPTEDRAFT_178842 [Capitella teleta]|uniref:NAD-dependent epimerase/dehydratase domain-containing protein n=1 Tax=Capitella teleta TaxID=283909 RepID=R7VGA2_CAPTE|nr:hypothetical protein CAPTEDRAFT_178842 [Capitella teleta]|eukprot:ELU17602.1 hypothetical protein CAPTEDRAFT_178842 [Capitella teleta]